MFKLIVGNSRGMSLMETVVASAISIVIAMGVMQINQNASKGMSRVEAKADLVDFRVNIKQKLAKTTTGGTKFCTNALTKAGANYFNGSTNVAADVTANRFSADGAFDDLVVGQNMPGAPSMRVESITRKAFANNSDPLNPVVATNGVQGRCDLLVELTNTRISQQGSFFVTIPIVCTVDDTATPSLESCTVTTEDASDGVGQMVDDGSGSEVMEFPGGLGGPRMALGDVEAYDALNGGAAPTGSLSTIDATLTLFPMPGTNDSPLGGGLLAGIDMPNNGTITWGDTLGSETMAMYGDETTMTIYMTDTLDVGQKIDSRILEATVAMYSPNYYYSSDERYKRDIEDIENASESLAELRGVTYFMRRDEFPDKGFEDTKQIGLIAQEVEAVFPELVHTAGDGYKSVKYGNVVAILIEAVKEQMDEIKHNRELFENMHYGIYAKNVEQDARIEALEKENQDLRLELQDVREQLEELNKKVDKLLMYKED